MAVIGDVDDDSDLPPVPGDELRAINVRDPQQFAETLLRLLNLPAHRCLILSRQTRQNYSTHGCRNSDLPWPWERKAKHRQSQARLALILILSAGYSPVLGKRVLVTSGIRPASRSRPPSSAGEYLVTTMRPSGRSSHSSPLPPCVITINTPPGLSTERTPASAWPSIERGRWCSEYEAIAPAQLADRSGRASRSPAISRAAGTIRAAAA